MGNGAAPPLPRPSSTLQKNGHLEAVREGAGWYWYYCLPWRGGHWDLQADASNRNHLGFLLLPDDRVRSLGLKFCQSEALLKPGRH